ncbi:leucine--tRNA ligase [Parasediminibacterium paludis]|uniref:Leucine--tRNA ligase n=1 Tax=Parasediminibacterium paludis TaxID=908966 RepID=A0ABV8PWE7_9BACT
MEYKFREIEKKWQEAWAAKQAYKVSNISDKPKCYVLDMFPYPSGAGLHVGHPLGYISSDIYSRFKRLKGFNVLHPMGYDAFGLPAEQYAIEHGIHPEISTANNINNFRAQLDKIGFSYDWDREVNTSKPEYYKWTQWIFLQLFNSWFNRAAKKAEPIATLVSAFEKEGSKAVDGQRLTVNAFSATEWQAFDEKTKQSILMEFRLAYCGYGEVNWCEALGTVLANDEVVNGVSERGGHPVVKKKLRQWYLRITEYADRLLEGLQTVDFSDAMKEMQTNWIGKSYGAEITFEIKTVDRQPSTVDGLTVYTTRPDTIFGVDFMVIAPELEWIPEVVSAEQQQAVEDYLAYVKSRSDRERQAEKKISGVFTGAYAINPFDGREIPIWISEYVLAGYGTGAIMAVPCGDERDFKFAKHFNIPITNILGDAFNGEEPNPTKDAILTNSGFLNGMVLRDAIDVVISKLEEMGIGTRKTNFKMRDAAFSRQRYWGEPFPIQWKDSTAFPLAETELPLELPKVDSYSPGPEGEGPLANIPEWVAKELETNTMPGYAGSSWYFLRYMDPHNTEAFASRQATDYWNQVDLYIGGTEHAVGHLLYSRMWTKALYDLGFIGFDEPFKKLLNQGMITGSSRFVYRLLLGFNDLEKHGKINTTNTIFLSKGLVEKVGYNIEDLPKEFLDSLQIILDKYEIDVKKDIKTNGYYFNSLHVDVNIVDGVELDIEAFKKYKNGEYANAEFILEDGKYICGVETEKMSKSKLNTVNPNDLVYKFGADTFRMYEMFLGPVDQSKPWDTKGIEGVHRFLKKLWRLFFDDVKGKVWNENEPTAEELKILHRTIQKIESDTERFSFNTAVSAFMVCVNDLADVKCNKRAILQPLLVLLAPYAPHIAEELWAALGNEGLVIDAAYPIFEAKYVAESSKDYPVSINGKVRTNINIALDAEQADVEQIVLANETVQKWLEGKAPKKIIFVKNRMINIVP